MGRLRKFSPACKQVTRSLRARQEAPSLICPAALVVALVAAALAVAAEAVAAEAAVGVVLVVAETAARGGK